jgi:hypothetical protein
VNDNPTDAPDDSTESPRRRIVAALRHALDAADPGTLAALRHGDPSSPPVAFYRVSVQALDAHLPEGGTRRDALEMRWAVVVYAMSSAQGLLARIPMGEAMAKADVAEMRLLRLLEAHGLQLADLVRHVVHQLVQKAQPFDPNDLADLVLSDDTEWAHAPRARIARSFYRHQSA